MEQRKINIAELTSHGKAFKHKTSDVYTHMIVFEPPTEQSNDYRDYFSEFKIHKFLRVANFLET